MKFTIARRIRQVMACASATMLLASLSVSAAAAKTRQLTPGDHAKISGLILSRDGDLVRVRQEKSPEVIVVAINDKTSITRKKHKLPFYRHTDMDVTALLPGLTIEAEGVANSHGQLNASKISFTPDDFAIEVAQEQQVLRNNTSAQNAHARADEAANAASQAQSSADHARVSAEQAVEEAKLAGAVAVADAAGIADVDERVSDLDHYTNKFEVDVFFPEGSVVLDSTAKRDLANLADIAKSLDGYMVEISGYAAHHKYSLEEDQRLSEERAAAVARFLLETNNIPLRRILVPVGYGATHPVASNSDPHGRELNRHVDVKIIVNKSLGQGM